MPKSKKPSQTLNLIAAQIVPTRGKISERIYSNFVQVAHSPHDFTLTFCDVLPLDDDQKAEFLKSHKIPAPIQVEVVMPHSLIEPLIKAIAENYEKFKKVKEQ